MSRQAGLPRTSARSGRFAPDARSLRGKPAQPLHPSSSEKPVSNPKSVKFSDPISVHFSMPIDRAQGEPRAAAPLGCALRARLPGAARARLPVVPAREDAGACPRREETALAPTLRPPRRQHPITRFLAARHHVHPHAWAPFRARRPAAWRPHACLPQHLPHLQRQPATDPAG